MLELIIHESFPLTDDNKYIDVVASVARQWGSYVHRSPATVPFDVPANLEFDFHCRSVAEFPHIVSSDGHKWVISAMVAAGVLPDRRWKHVGGFVDRFFIDAKDPRLVVRIV